MQQYQEVEILLAEDNADDAILTIRALRKHNLANNLVHLQDGAQLLDFLYGQGDFQHRDIDNLPRVILLDLKMPKVDGLEALSQIKSDPRLRMVPVVVLTSSTEDPDVKRCYELGANSYIVKPVDFDNFIHAVANLGLYWMLLNRTSN